jgi:hypothetical protein
MSSLNYMELCRLCLVKERMSILIVEGVGDVRQIFLKIAACLPVKSDDTRCCINTICPPEDEQDIARNMYM